MNKIYLPVLPFIALILNACGGGGGASTPFDPQKNLTPQENLQKSHLELDGSTISSQTFNKYTGLNGNSNSITSYTPSREIDINQTAHMRGSSVLTFNGNTITLNMETCITTDTDCSLYREAALAGGWVKMKKISSNPVSKYYKGDQVPYYRIELTLTNTEKETSADVTSNYNSNFNNTFDVYHLSSYTDRSSGVLDNFKNAKYIDVLDNNKDRFNDSSSRRYWGRNGVDNEWPMILTLVTKTSFSNHARLGLLMKKYVAKSTSYETATTVYPVSTTAPDLSKVGASYKKTDGWQGLGRINGRTVYLKGNVDITFNQSTSKLTQFNVENMKQYEFDSASHMRKFKNTPESNFLNSVKLQLVGGNSVDYDANGKYSAILTETGGSTGRDDKFDVKLNGKFYGKDADATAGAFTMQKNGDNKADNTVGGGFVADKQ